MRQPVPTRPRFLRRLDHLFRQPPLHFFKVPAFCLWQREIAVPGIAGKCNKGAQCIASNNDDRRLHKASGAIADALDEFPYLLLGQLLAGNNSVFEAYNVATACVTHEARSATVAFALLDRINSGFQEEFPVNWY